MSSEGGVLSFHLVLHDSILGQRRYLFPSLLYFMYNVVFVYVSNRLLHS